MRKTYLKYWLNQEQITLEVDLDELGEELGITIDAIVKEQDDLFIEFHDGKLIVRWPGETCKYHLPVPLFYILERINPYTQQRTFVHQDPSNYILFLPECVIFGIMRAQPKKFSQIKNEKKQLLKKKEQELKELVDLVAKNQIKTVLKTDYGDIDFNLTTLYVLEDNLNNQELEFKFADNSIKKLKKEDIQKLYKQVKEAFRDLYKYKWHAQQKLKKLKYKELLNTSVESIFFEIANLQRKPTNTNITREVL